MRALTELLTVFVAGIFAFLAAICGLIALLVLWLCGLVSALMLIVAAGCGLGFVLTGNHHYGLTALGFLIYAAVPSAVVGVLTYYSGKFTDAQESRRSLRRVGGVRLAQDEPFEAVVIRR
ncbi:MAG: hypothetical protein ACRYHQ_39270 [Janthinobacterium lividum]